MFAQQLSGKQILFNKIKKIQQNIAPVSSKEFLDIQATIEYKFTLKRVLDMIITYNQTHFTDKYSQHNSVIWSVWLNGWVFVYELSGCGFEFRCSHQNLVFNEKSSQKPSVAKFLRKHCVIQRVSNILQTFQFLSIF